MENFANSLLRKKVIPRDETESSDLIRCLSTFNLVSIGVGSTLGAGVYVLAGDVARNDAGPSIIVSFCVAAFASLLAGLCYAEFGARVPKAGSAYIYSYVTVGEFCGFVVGWNLILEYIIGVSSVSRAFSANLDSLTGGVIAKTFREAMPINIHGFATYPDFVSVGLIAIVTVLLSIGMKVSSLFLSILTAVNIVILVFCAVAGFINADIHNWQLSPDEIPAGFGSGGFMPYGFSKMMEGAATCFFAFVGFDTIACVGEEAKNPSKSIPRSILITLLVCLVAYVSVSAALTLMEPYYNLDANAPLPVAFKNINWYWASIPIAIGSMCALIASVLGAAVGMPRIVFSMARDGLIFKFFSQVSEQSGSPVIATVASGILSSLMALMFNLEDLVNMMSIGTLMAYTLVAFSVLVLRYRPHEEDTTITLNNAESSILLPQDSSRYFSLRNLCFPVVTWPTTLTSQVVVYASLLAVSIMILLGVLLVWGGGNVVQWWGILLIVTMAIIVIIMAAIIYRQPESLKRLSFQTPIVPVIPMLSLFVNIYLMLKLPTTTWIRFAVWMVIGFVMYFGYGMWHSTARAEATESNERVNGATVEEFKRD